MEVTRREVLAISVSAVVTLVYSDRDAAVNVIPDTPDYSTNANEFTSNQKERFYRELVAQVGADDYQRWFKSLEVSHMSAGVLALTVPVVFQRRWIPDLFGEPLLLAASRAHEGVQEVRVVVRKQVPKFDGVPVV